MPPNLMQWKVFRDGKCDCYLQDYDGIHFFNEGKSAVLMKEEKLYAIGAYHKCCMFPDQGNTNTVPWMSKPVLIENLNTKGIKALSTGNEHAVLLDNDGHVFCWGSNASGQLGNGLTGETTKPFKTNLEDITQISCGETFTIALSKHNELWFWGTLCFSTGEVFHYTTPVLIEIPGSPSIKLISASQHVALLADNGKVFTWGINSCGQLGLGNRSDAKEPQLISSTVTFKYVQCGTDMTTFVSEDGLLYYCNSLTNNSIKCLCETNICKKVAAIAAHWRNTVIVVVNENGHRFRSFDVTFKGTLMRISQDILDVFIDIGTPSIQPIQMFSGITPIRTKQRSETLKEKKCMGNVDVTHLYESEDFSDIQIKLSDGILHLHKLILAAKSVNFSQRILGNPQLKMLDMSNMNASAYRTYLKYLYTGILEIKAILDIPEIYFLGDQDKNEKVKKMCRKTWMDLLNKENVLSAFLAAYSQNVKALMEACGPTLQLNLSDIMASEQYSKLTYEDKLSLLTIASLSTCK